MAKPTTLPRWANSGGAVATPAAGKLDIGWLSGEKPAAQYMNWLQLHTYNWLNWLDTIFPANVLTLDANKDVVISGTARYKHGTYTLQIAGNEFETVAQTTAYNRVIGGLTSVPPWNYAIKLPIGARILGARIYIRDSVTGPTTVALRLNKFTASTNTSTTITTSSNSAGTAAYQTLSITGLTEVITSGIMYQLDVLLQAGSASCTIHGAELDYDMP